MSEWARLRAGATTRGGLERGYWYPVHLKQPDGVVWLKGPDESTVPFEPGLLRLVTAEPEVITRLPEGEFQSIRPGEPAAQIKHYGICPRGHFVRDIGATDRVSDCRTCKKRYAVEDEDP